MPFLKMALIHAVIHHKCPEANRENILAAFRQAGEKKASLVIAPELALSGNFFCNRHDIAPYVETGNGPTLTELATITRHYGLYACIGLAEHDPGTGIFYNSAFVLDPAGTVVCRCRKINPENRWACPGDPKENNTFDTPWGRIGVLIGSDTYESLLPRITGLRGANLLMVPANWAPTGINPKDVWRARALENGMSLIACNRTGMDMVTDYSQAPSVAFDSQGKTFLGQSHQKARVFQAHLPLNSEYRFKAGQRLRCLVNRNSFDSHACYLSLATIPNLTSYLHLPPAGRLHLVCSVPRENEDPLIRAQDDFLHPDTTSDTLHVLPAWKYSDVSLDKLRVLCGTSGQKAVVRRTIEHGFAFHYFDGARQPQQWEVDTSQNSAAPQMISLDCGPARILIATFRILVHPEHVLAAAKQGCDLVVISEHSFSPENRLLSAVRTIDNVATAVCTSTGGGIWMTPEKDQRWEETLAEPGQACCYVLDTHRTRRKHFQDRLDYETLFATYNA
ncbi:carbon-nitrogen hydrolase family protein [Desulfobulbus elongatus]|uniref:carbon-nitrogen hydrolase family protein n=1 Tax=Desulfobulbus elongatus TaxID=53332 RepID=UPI0006852384|nr:carbon-nitrogen hydrolase family protein [Desulfobulbus elongatus]